VTLRFASGSVVVALGVVLCCVAGNSTVAALASVTFSIRLRRHARTLPDGTPTQIAGRPAVRGDDIVTRLRHVAWLAEEGSEVTDLAATAADEIERLLSAIRTVIAAGDGLADLIAKCGCVDDWERCDWCIAKDKWEEARNV
jgi:hypothetical protein